MPKFGKETQQAIGQRIGGCWWLLAFVLGLASWSLKTKWKWILHGKDCMPLANNYLLRQQHLDFDWPVVSGKFMVMFIRDVVICNPHPYYCGIAAGQFASSVSNKSLTILDWLRILWLPSVLHFTHNFCSFPNLKGLRWTVDVLTFLLFIRLWRKKGQQEWQHPCILN